MKRFLVLAFTLISVPSVQASTGLSYRDTICNIRYNNLGVIAGSIPCKAWFNTSGSLSRVKFFYPKTGRWYDWSVSQKLVEGDKRWAECIRYTRPEGNQWQVCTVPSPQQLGL